MRGCCSLVFTVVLSWACAAGPPARIATYLTPSSHLPAPSANQQPKPASPCAAVPSPLGRVQSDELDEISGVAASHRQPGILFVHNDSGDSARFFALDQSGALLAELDLPTVPAFVDAEDIAVGPGPGGGDFVYIADSGNNFALSGIGIPRRKAVVLRVREPEIPRGARALLLTVREVFPIVLTFPDGARDVEAIFIDPISGELVMLSKSLKGSSQVLTASPALLEAGGGELKVAGTMRFGAKPLSGNPMVTSASVSRDGRAVLVRTYSSVFLFARDAGEPIMAALARPARQLPSARERQGEAITFFAADQAYLTISEGPKPALNCAAVPPH